MICKSLAAFLLFALAAVAACNVSVQSGDDHARVAPTSESVIFLIRHAEALYPPPEDEPGNPPLNSMGQDRADALARLLSAEALDHLWSTEYRRTQETAAPLAALTGLAVEPYDPSDLDAFAEQLRTMPGRHVVFGHSNTTSELVAALGGDPGESIDDEREFDRFYVVTLSGSGQATTTLLRYGAATPADWREHAATRR